MILLATIWVLEVTPVLDNVPLVAALTSLSAIVIAIVLWDVMRQIGWFRHHIRVSLALAIGVGAGALYFFYLKEWPRPVPIENVYFESHVDCDDFWKVRSADLIDAAHARRHGLYFGTPHQKPVPHAAPGAQASYACVEKEKP